jgi:hypothetical protein
MPIKIIKKNKEIFAQIPITRKIAYPFISNKIINQTYFLGLGRFNLSVKKKSTLNATITFQATTYSESPLVLNYSYTTLGDMENEISVQDSLIFEKNQMSVTQKIKISIENTYNNDSVLFEVRAKNESNITGAFNTVELVYLETNEE